MGRARVTARADFPMAAPIMARKPATTGKGRYCHTHGPGGRWCGARAGPRGDSDLCRTRVRAHTSLMAA
eukprot:1656557-Prymnesium_polylepis.1